MKATWQTKKLGEIGTIFNGNSINGRVKKEKYLDLEDGFPFIATKDIDFETHSIDYENGIKIPFSEKSFKIAHKNSVLICAEGGSAGKKIAFNEKDICFGNKLFAIETNKDVDPKFVFYRYLAQDFFDTFKKQMNGIIGGVSIGNFKNLEISLPRLAEQKSIVKKLDKVFEKIATAKENAEKNLQNSKELFESYLQSVFANPEKDWEERSLEEVTDYLARGVSPKYITKGDVLVLNQKCIRNHEVSYMEARYHDNASKKYDTRKEIQVGDVLVNSTGVGTLGRVAQVKSVEITAIVDSHITIVRPKRGLFHDPFFGWAMIYVEDLIKELGAGASGQTELSRTTLKEVHIAYTKSHTVQKEIVKKLDSLSIEIKKLENIYEQKLADLEELKKSVLSKAFAGEL